MAELVKNARKTNSETDSEKPATPVFRETVESFCVALILAFLFRAFVAEAFVIPTGSMAPTLMGAHKDVTCPECGCEYQSNGSQEVDENGAPKLDVVIGATCPLCRYTMPLDLRNNPNHATFNGDRIIVSKFAYLFKKAARWDVIVFKWPGEARINFIKRLIGRPNESVLIKHGDIYISQPDSGKFVISRKTPSALGAMLQPLYDSKHQSKTLLKLGVPDVWQPFTNTAEMPETSWRIQQDASHWEANFNGAGKVGSPISWLRYHHRVIDSAVWDYLIKNDRLPPGFQSLPRLVTDFTSYNASTMALRSDIYAAGRETRSWRIPLISPSSNGLVSDYPKSELPSEYVQILRDQKPDEYAAAERRKQNPNIDNDGLHWVGDLAAEYELDIENDKGVVVLDLVEAGVHHQCHIDIETGSAFFKLESDGKELEAFEDGNEGYLAQPTATLPIQGAGKYRVRFANVDDALYLWVNGRLQKFSPSSRFEAIKLRGNSMPSPKYTATDPLDLSPVGIGMTGVQATVRRIRVWRDVYYIATMLNSEFSDYEHSEGILSIDFNSSLNYLREIGFDTDATRNEMSQKAIGRNYIYSTPSTWPTSRLFSARRQPKFVLGEGEYFPMGDNSPQSSDGRVWGYNLPENLMIGRAVLVFWPHGWNRPVPFTPNIKRMGLIR